MGKLSRTKGHSFERDIANLFKPMFPKARRQLEYHLDDCQGVDIQGVGRFKIQCKRFKGYAPINKIDEIQNASKSDIKLLVTKADNKPIIVALELSDFLDILKDVGEAYSEPS